MHDLLIRGGLVVDGTGIPGRPADVAISDGVVTAIGRLSGEAARETMDADGLVVAPGIVDAHTHYDPQITWDPLCDTSSLHGVTTVAAGNCGFSVAPCRSDDHEYLAQVFARVEGMEIAALGNIDWRFATFGEYLASRSGRLGLNLGMYVGHSAVRRWVLGDEAHQREATDDEIKHMAALVEEAMGDGALGMSSSHAPTHLDLADRPVPSRLASLDELRALADAVGSYARGSIAYAPVSAVEGIDAADRELLIELAARGGVPVVTQGLGGRSKVDAPTKTWEQSRAFLDDSARRGAPVFSLLMTRAFNGPFSLRDGSSRYDGVPLWRELMALDWESRRQRIADGEWRARLRTAIDNPNTDAAQGSTLPPPIWDVMAIEETVAAPFAALVGHTVGDVAKERGVHPADVMFDIALADPDAVFHWTNETPAWRTLLRDVQQHPQMLAGVSDGGAHLDFDDGAEWSTHFLATWWREEGVWRLEDAIRRITAIPAAVLGLTDRGLLQPGRPADVFVFDPERLRLGKRRKDRDQVTGTARFRSTAIGVRATVVNGTVVVDDGVPTGALPGQVVRPT
jgi:N-acyl-D-aspartate/D-glutamate deacylase